MMIKLHATLNKFPNTLYITPLDMIHKTTTFLIKEVMSLYSEKGIALKETTFFLKILPINSFVAIQKP